MQKTFKKVRVKHKYDTEANWTSKNPVLLSGELIFVSTADGVRQKIGNGTSTYSALPFIDEVLRNLIDGKADAHDHPYLPATTPYALSYAVGGAALFAQKMNVTRLVEQITTFAANLPMSSEAVIYAGSDGKTYGCPINYCVVNIKKGDAHRTIMDCYHLQTGDHYINGCMSADGVDDVWTGWIQQPNAAHITNLQTQLDTLSTRITELENALAALNVGFVATESDM